MSHWLLVAAQLFTAIDLLDNLRLIRRWTKGLLQRCHTSKHNWVETHLRPFPETSNSPLDVPEEAHGVLNFARLLDHLVCGPMIIHPLWRT